MKILLAEDDTNLGILLQEYLENKGFETLLVRDGNEGLNVFLKEKFHLCLLDIMMPKKDGFSLAKEIRIKDPEIPIIFLTAKSMHEDAIQGFKVGADDYITKPFNMEELLMRIKAIFRRTNPISNSKEQEVFDIGNYQFDSRIQELMVNDGHVKLTTKESELLKLFVQNKNQIVSRSYALKLIWGDDSYFNARSMDVYITKLRKHLKHDSNIQIINLHGEGFRLIC